jgi:pyridoxal/pyridoxine/pyridoxamine kinase
VAWTAIAERTTPSAVGSGDLLGGSFIANLSEQQMTARYVYNENPATITARMTSSYKHANHQSSLLDAELHTKI